MPNFTRKAIKSSFMKLLNEQPLSKISVKSIVEECGINRNSFYYHFSDIPALIEEIVKENFDALINKYPSITSIEACLNEAFRYILENKRAILHIYKSVNREVFEAHLMRFCEYIVTTYLETVFNASVGEADQKMIVRFLKCELFGIYIDWLNAGMPEDSIKEVNRMLSVCHGISEDIIRRCNTFDKERGRDAVSASREN